MATVILSPATGRQQSSLRQEMPKTRMVSRDMTVKELIDELSKFNEELDVLIEVAGSDDVAVEPRIILTHRKSGRSCLLLEN